MTGEVITESDIEGFEVCETDTEWLGTTVTPFVNTGYGSGSSDLFTRTTSATGTSTIRSSNTVTSTTGFSPTGYGGYGEGEEAVLILLDGPGGDGGGYGGGEEAVLITTATSWTSNPFTHPSFTGYEIATDVVKMNI